jgi:hypothetical protein
MDSELARIERNINLEPDNRAFHHYYSRMVKRCGRRVQGRTLSEWLDVLGADNMDSSQGAIDALTFFGFAALPMLANISKTGGWFARMKAIEALGRLGAPGRIYLEGLQDDEDFAIRRAVQKQLKRFKLVSS